MEVMCNNFMPGDSRLVEQLVYELKSQGIFDQFRKECIADVDTKPAYQNLRQRVEGSVVSFLNQQAWSADLNKNQLREQLRKSLHESGILETGVERIVDQVVNPKINTVFLPKVEEVVYRFLGVARPNRSTVKEEKKEVSITDLLPTDLEAVSPGSVDSFKADKKERKDDSTASVVKNEEDESPPFEPLDVKKSQEHSILETDKLVVDENSRDSHLSGVSGLQSQDSNHGSYTKTYIMDLSNQDSINSSETHLSIVTSEDTTKMEICEDSNSETKTDEADKVMAIEKDKKLDDLTLENEKKEKKTDDKKSRSSDKSNSKDKKDDKHRKSSSSSKDREKSSSKHSSHKDKRDSKSSSSHRDKDKSKDRSDKDKEKSSKHRDKTDKDKSKSDKDKSEKDKHKSKSEKHETDKDKNKSDKDNKKSDKEKSNKDKDKYRSDKEKSSREKEKYKEKSEKSDKVSKYKEKSDSKELNDNKDKSKKAHDSTKDKDKNPSKHSSEKDKKRDSSSHKDRSSNSNSTKSSNGDSKSKLNEKLKKETDKQSSNSSSSKKDSRKKSKDDHYGSKIKKTDRRSTDRDSNDGSGKPNYLSSYSESTSSRSGNNSQEYTNSSCSGGSGDSGNSDQVEVSSKDENITTAVAEVPKVKYFKPKFASNFQEARKLMKIRKQLAKLERQNQLSLTKIEVPLENGINCDEHQTNVSLERDMTCNEGLKPEEQDINTLTTEVGVPVIEISNKNSINTSINGNDTIQFSTVGVTTSYTKDVSSEVVSVSNIDTNTSITDVTKSKTDFDLPTVEANSSNVDNLSTKELNSADTEFKLSNSNTDVHSNVELDSSEINPLKIEVNNSNTELNSQNREVNTEKIISEASSLNRTDLSKENFEALEAKLAHVMSKIDHNSYGSDEEYEFYGYSSEDICKPSQQLIQVDKSENQSLKHKLYINQETSSNLNNNLCNIKFSKGLPQKEEVVDKNVDCRYLEKPSQYEDINLSFLSKLILQLQKEVNESMEISQNNGALKRGKKRKIEECVDIKNNNIEVATTDISSGEHFSLPLSPAESDKSVDRKDEDLLIPMKQKRIIRGYSQRYTSEDLYKPRPIIGRRNKYPKNTN